MRPKYNILRGKPLTVHLIVFYPFSIVDCLREYQVSTLQKVFMGTNTMFEAGLPYPLTSHHCYLPCSPYLWNVYPSEICPQRSGSEPTSINLLSLGTFIPMWSIGLIPLAKCTVRSQHLLLAAMVTGDLLAHTSGYNAKVLITVNLGRVEAVKMPPWGETSLKG